MTSRWLRDLRLSIRANESEFDALVRMRKSVSLNARKIVGGFEPGQSVLDELVDLRSDPLRLIERADSHREVATSDGQRVSRRDVFAI